MVYSSSGRVVIFCPFPFVVLHISRHRDSYSMRTSIIPWAGGYFPPQPLLCLGFSLSVYWFYPDCHGCKFSPTNIFYSQVLDVFLRTREHVLLQSHFALIVYRSYQRSIATIEDLTRTPIFLLTVSFAWLRLIFLNELMNAWYSHLSFFPKTLAL